MAEHGGRLRQASLQYGHRREAWLDLSTGVNPNGYGSGSGDADAWGRLPEPDDGLMEAACKVYGGASLTPTAGSIAAIRALPRLFAPGPVAILEPTFNEHEASWRRAGHDVSFHTAQRFAEGVERAVVAVVCQPNNPTGFRFDRQTLLEWATRLHAKGGALIVDEAFIDATPGESVASDAGAGLIVLRSLGKFYGLAGARVGFAIGAAPLLARLDDELGPWSVAGPSRSVAMEALGDEAWRRETIVRLGVASARLARLLEERHLAPNGGTALFQWVVTDEAARIYDELARRAILVRRFDAPNSLRFGLPGTEDDWRRLDAALREVMG